MWVASEVVGLSLDVYAIAEKVASVINSKVGSRLEQLERRVKQLEAIMDQLHSTTIEAVVRSMLYVKMDELAKAIALRVAGSLSSTSAQLQTAIEKLESTTSKLESELAAVKAVEKIAEKLGKLDSVLAKLDELSKIQVQAEHVAKLTARLDELSSRLEEVEKRLDQLAKSMAAVKKLEEVSDAIEKLTSEIRALEEIVVGIKEDSKYASQVLKMIEERLRSSGGSEGS